MKSTGFNFNINHNALFSDDFIHSKLIIIIFLTFTRKKNYIYKLGHSTFDDLTVHVLDFTTSRL